MNKRDEPELSRIIRTKSSRKLKAKRSGDPGVWFGLGMMGLIGWSIAIPTFLGALLGFWLDKHVPARSSWTLTFLFIGLIVGCINAWYWVRKESAEIDEEQDLEEDEDA